MTLDDVAQRTSALMNGLQKSLPPEFLDDSLIELLAAMRSTFSTVVVIGEFNRGKSSLVNAILGQDLLPRDVLPTTAALHVIRWAEAPLLRIHAKSGKHFDRTLCSEELTQLVVGAAADPDLGYIEIGLPIHLLRDLVIVDTPGVGDMNQQRTDVTYSFVPRADVVLFVLDATTPVRRSEIEFLESAVLSSGIERIIFVANSADGIDPDDYNQSLDSIRNRLRSALGHSEVRVLLFSATQALAAIQSGDETMIDRSGLAALLLEIERLRNEGVTAYERSIQFIARADVASRKCIASLDAATQSLERSDTELAESMRKLELVISGADLARAELRRWADCRRDELLAMTTKSLATFTFELLSDVQTTISEYNGPQIKELVEQRIPRIVRQHYKVWIEDHAPAIKLSLQKIDSRLCAAVAQYCDRSIAPSAAGLGTLTVNNAGNDLGVTLEDTSFTSIKAGLVTALAAGMLILVGAPVLVPLASMAGFPLLSKLWSERKLRDAKMEVTSKIKASIEQSTLNFKSAVLSAVDKDIETLVCAAENQLSQTLNAAKQQAESEFAKRRSSQHDNEIRRKQLLESRQSVLAVLAELRKMGSKKRSERNITHD